MEQANKTQQQLHSWIPGFWKYTALKNQQITCFQQHHTFFRSFGAFWMGASSDIVYEESTDPNLLNFLELSLNIQGVTLQ